MQPGRSTHRLSATMPRMGLSTSRVLRFWALAVSDAMGREVVAATPLLGGHYAQSWRITIDGPPHTLVGRRLPAGSATPIAAVNRLLDRCRAAGVPCPTPLWARGSAGLGRQYQLVTWIDGSTEPPEPSTEVACLADALMRLSTVDSCGIELPTFPLLPSPRWQARLRRHPAGRRALDALLEMSAPTASPGVVHGDLCQANLVWSSTKLVGIIDWDRASLAPGGVDIAMVWTDLLIRHGLDIAESILERLEMEAGARSELRYWQLRMLASSFGGEIAPDGDTNLRAGLEFLAR